MLRRTLNAVTRHVTSYRAEDQQRRQTGVVRGGTAVLLVRKSDREEERQAVTIRTGCDIGERERTDEEEKRAISGEGAY